jgi:hypothetical protein
MFDLSMELLINLLSIPSSWSKRKQWLVASVLSLSLGLICLLAFLPG